MDERLVIMLISSITNLGHAITNLAFSINMYYAHVAFVLDCFYWAPPIILAIGGIIKAIVDARNAGNP